MLLLIVVIGIIYAGATINGMYSTDKQEVAVLLS
jgi:type II secretory pathway pseudopilin PulG